MKYFLILFSLLMSLSCTGKPTKSAYQKKGTQKIENTDENNEKDCQKKSFVIVTAGRNAEKYCEWCVKSLLQQNYTYVRFIIIDDASTDNTYPIVHKTIAEYGQGKDITLIRNEVRQGALANYYYAIWEFVQDYEIVVIVDLDDALDGSEVLNYLNSVYSNPCQEIWLTYGQFRNLRAGTRGFCCPMPEHIVKANAFRQWQHGPSHLRTFYAWLFKRIKEEDLKWHGCFFEMTYDLAIMFPMIEMARDHFMFIDRVLLIYNDGNPLSDHHINWQLQQRIATYLRAQQPYGPLIRVPIH
ncbi:MAG: glycosyltransferase family A protein [Candidatus Babeliaceae bacterium]